MQPLRQLVMTAVAGTVVVCAGMLGYGAVGGTAVNTVTGSAYVGLEQAGMFSNEGALAVPSDAPWQARDGSWHARGFPSCLDKAGTFVTIRVGVMAVSQPDGSRTQKVIWLSCRG